MKRFRLNSEDKRYINVVLSQENVIEAIDFSWKLSADKFRAFLDSQVPSLYFLNKDLTVRKALDINSDNISTMFIKWAEHMKEEYKDDLDLELSMLDVDDTIGHGQYLITRVE